MKKKKRLLPGVTEKLRLLKAELKRRALRAKSRDDHGDGDDDDASRSRAQRTRAFVSSSIHLDDERTRGQQRDRL